MVLVCWSWRELPAGVLCLQLPVLPLVEKSISPSLFNCLRNFLPILRLLLLGFGPSSTSGPLAATWGKPWCSHHWCLNFISADFLVKLKFCGVKSNFGCLWDLCNTVLLMQLVIGPSLTSRPLAAVRGKPQCNRHWCLGLISADFLANPKFCA